MSKHGVFKLVQLKNNLPYDISSVASYGQRVFLGTSDNGLLIYEITNPTPVNGQTTYKVDAKDIRANLTPEKKTPINQILPIPQLDLLLTLVDGVIYQHQLASLKVKSPVKDLKYCIAFTVKREKNRYSMAAITQKKKLVLYDYIDSTVSDFVFKKEVNLKDTPEKVYWSASNVAVGFAKEYCLIDVTSQTNTITELIATGTKKAPIAVILDDTNELLLGKDNVGIMVSCENGKPTKRSGHVTNWTSKPTFLEYSSPFVVSVQQNLIEVNYPFIPENNLCQTIPLQHVECLSCSHLCCFEQSAVRTRRLLYVTTSTKCLYLLEFVPFPEQIQELVKKGEYEIALQISEHITRTNMDEPIPQPLIEDIHRCYGFYLFKQKQYQEAMKAFTRANVDPRLVISLYDFLPKYVKECWFEAKKMNEQVPGGHIDAIPSDQLANAIDALSGFLRDKWKPVPEGFDPLVHDKSDEGTKFASIDTALLRCYLECKPDAVKDLVRSPNRCVVEDSQNALLKKLRFEETTWFYFNKGLHKEALSLLQKQNQEAEASQSSDRLLATKVTPKHTIEYLQRLNNDPDPHPSYKELIKTYSVWVLQKVHYTNSLRTILPLLESEVMPNGNDTLLKMPLRPAPVVNGVPQTVLSAGDSLKLLEQVMPKEYDVRIHYLQMMINKHSCKDADLHDALALLYITKMSSKDKDISKREEMKQVIFSAKLFMKSSQYYRPDRLLEEFVKVDVPELQALLFWRMEKHDIALNIYANKLKDHTQAVEYCMDQIDKPSGKDIFNILLSLYLKPLDSSDKAQVDKALQLLNNYFTRIDPVKAIQLLELHDDIDVSALSNWLGAVIRHNSLKRRNLQIQKNLLKTQHREMHEKSVVAKAASVTIDQETKCEVCGKKILTAVFARFPDEKVVHIRSQCINEYEARFRKS